MFDVPPAVAYAEVAKAPVRSAERVSAAPKAAEAEQFGMSNVMVAGFDQYERHMAEWANEKAARAA